MCSKINLPDDIEALWFACQCFDIQEKDFENNFRVTVARAIAGSKRRKEVEDKLWNQLLHRFRVSGVANPSPANSLADDVTATLLYIYRQLRPLLDTSNVSLADSLWILTEQVLLPTLYFSVATYRNSGTGTEFFPESFWFIPRVENRKVIKPIPRILDFWLRTAKLHTGYGFEKHLKPPDSKKQGKQLKPGSTKHRVEQWLNGTTKPKLQEAFDFIDTTAEQISWLDDATVWKTRLALAFAIQTACDHGDKLFRTIMPPQSLDIAKQFQSFSKEGILANDDGKVLSQLGIFFASRLLQLRLERTGELQVILKSVPSQMNGSFEAGDSDETIESHRKHMDRKMNPSNAFADYIFQKAIETDSITASAGPAVAYVQLQEYIFKCGAEELNRLLDAKRKKGRRAKTRRP
jgi:hypothetical protein